MILGLDYIPLTLSHKKLCSDPVQTSLRNHFFFYMSCAERSVFPGRRMGWSICYAKSIFGIACVGTSLRLWKNSDENRSFKRR